ncbi:MAG: GAF domain-containing protein [Microbacteriaceae bacterium]|nr:GAF domain-containing protein [Microbacteriaceae bacterium]
MERDNFLTFPDAPRDGLDRVLGELVELANDVLTTQGRLRALLRANQLVVQQLELPIVLQRIVEVAVELVGAQYGALGVIAPHGGLEQFIHIGVPPETVERIGHLPKGRGLIGALIDDPNPIRLRNINGDPRSAGFPPGHPPMDSFLGVPVRVRDEVYGNLYLTNRTSGAFTPEDEELVIALAATAGFAIDNARLYAETKRRQAWAAASAEITAALLSDDFGDSIALLAARVLTLSEAALVCVMVPTSDPDHLIVGTARGQDAERWEGARVPVAGSIAGRVMVGRQPRLVEEGDETVSVVHKDYRFGPTMAVPLLASGRALGVLTVTRRLGERPFSEADLGMAADFAGQASVAMELATARADRQLILILEDRSRIARDLHDHVIQQLFATGLELQSVVGALPPGVSAERIDTAISNLDKSISQIRTAIFALSGTRGHRPDTIRRRLIDVVNEVSVGLVEMPRLSFSGPVDLVITGALADDVVAVVREALSNVARHADAEHVTVVLQAIDGFVGIEVTDDGVGITDPQRRSGLANLHERAARRGGSFTIDSDEGHTVALWSAPYGADTEVSA